MAKVSMLNAKRIKIKAKIKQRYLFNKSYKTALKNLMYSLEKETNLEKAQLLLNKIYQSADKLTVKNIYHQNKAIRFKIKANRLFTQKQTVVTADNSKTDLDLAASKA